MQRVSALLPSWNQSRSSTGSTTSKTSLDKVRGWADFIPSPANRLSGSRLGKEAFWPGTLDKECEKAARILKAFCRTLAPTPPSHARMMAMLITCDVNR